MTERTIRIRPATARDTAAILEITRPVWDGHDYLPRVWNDWLADSAGYLAALEVDGRVEGFQHVQIQNDGTGWIEGIRVRVDTHSRGLGLALLEDGLRWACENGVPRVRLCTYGGNPASNRIAVKAGLTELARVKILSVDAAQRDGTNCCRVAIPAEIDEVEAFVRARAGERPLYTEGWTAYTLDRRRLRLLLATSAVLVIGEDPVVGVAIVTTSVGHSSLRLGFIDGAPAAVELLARSLSRRAAGAGLDRVVCHARISAETEGALERAGYIWRDGDEMVLYGLGLSEEQGTP